MTGTIFSLIVCRTMVAVKSDRNGYTNFALKCVAAYNGEWKCDTELEIRHYGSYGIAHSVECKEVHAFLCIPLSN